MYIYLYEQVQNTVCFIYMACSHVQVLLPRYVDVIIWPCAVVSPPGVQNCSNFRDLQCESLLQLAISAATTQKEWNPLQEQNGFLRKNGAALYERHNTPPSKYMTEPRHRAFVNGATTKWCENDACSVITTKCCQCVLLAYHTLLYNCCVLLFKFARMFLIQLHGEFFLGDGLQKSDVSENIFAAFFRRLYHTYDCVLVVALEICVMWLLLLIRPSATA